MGRPGQILLVSLRLQHFGFCNACLSRARVCIPDAGPWVALVLSDSSPFPAQVRPYVRTTLSRAACGFRQSAAMRAARDVQVVCGCAGSFRGLASVERARIVPQPVRAPHECSLLVLSLSARASWTCDIVSVCVCAAHDSV